MKKSNLNYTYYGRVESDKSKNIQRMNMTQFINLEKFNDSEDSHDEYDIFKKRNTSSSKKRRQSSSKKKISTDNTKNESYKNIKYNEKISRDNKNSKQCVSNNTQKEKNENFKRGIEQPAKLKINNEKSELPLKHHEKKHIKEKSKNVETNTEYVQTDYKSFNENNSSIGVCVPTIETFNKLNKRISEIEQYRINDHVYQEFNKKLINQNEKIKILEEKLKKLDYLSSKFKVEQQENKILENKSKEHQTKNDILISLYICAHKLFINLDSKINESLHNGTSNLKKEQVPQLKEISCFFCEKQGHSTLNCSTIIKNKNSGNEESMHLD